MIDSLPIAMRPGQNQVIGSGFTSAAQVVMASASMLLVGAPSVRASRGPSTSSPYIFPMLIRVAVIMAPKSQFPISSSEYCRLIFVVLALKGQ